MNTSEYNDTVKDKCRTGGESRKIQGIQLKVSRYYMFTSSVRGTRYLVGFSLSSPMVMTTLTLNGFSSNEPNKRKTGLTPMSWFRCCFGFPVCIALPSKGKYNYWASFHGNPLAPPHLWAIDASLAFFHCQTENTLNGNTDSLNNSSNSYNINWLKVNGAINSQKTIGCAELIRMNYTESF